MNYIENIFTLETVTEELFERVFKIYNTNQDYFIISMNTKPSMKSVIEDKNEIPPGISLQKKNYKLISLNGKDIGVIDYLLGYPDEDSVYIGLFMINGAFHRSGYGKEFIEEFTTNMRNQGYSRLRLGVLNQNNNGFSFWEKVGFVVIKEMFSTIHPERNWKIKVMEKTI